MICRVIYINMNYEGSQNLVLYSNLEYIAFRHFLFVAKQIEKKKTWASVFIITDVDI